MATKTHQLVQMRMLPETIEVLGGIKNALQAANRTDAIVRCINIAKIVIDAIHVEGKDFQLVGRDGSIERIVIPGLKPQAAASQVTAS